MSVSILGESDFLRLKVTYTRLERESLISLLGNKNLVKLLPSLFSSQYSIKLTGSENLLVFHLFETFKYSYIKAFIMPFAFALASSNSLFGIESATIPPPALIETLFLSLTIVLIKIFKSILPSLFI